MEYSNSQHQSPAYKIAILGIPCPHSFGSYFRSMGHSIPLMRFIDPGAGTIVGMIFLCLDKFAEPDEQMKKVTDIIFRMISRNSRSLAQKKANSFDYVESTKGILRELMISRESGNLIGLFSPILGEGMFFIAVSSIEPDNSIVFRKYDIRDGRLLSAGTLCLSDIRGVCPFIRFKQRDQSLSEAPNYLL